MSTQTAVQPPYRQSRWMNEAAAAVEAERRPPDAAGRRDRRRRPRDQHDPRLRARSARRWPTQDEHAARPALILAGKTLVSTVGGASGPLWGSALRARRPRARRRARVRRARQLVDALDAALGGGRQSSAPPSRATRRWSTRSARRWRRCASGSTRATRSPRRARRGRRRRGGGRARHHADAGAQGPRVVPRRALRRSPGPGRDLDRADHPGARRRPRHPGLMAERILRGLPASPGLAIGCARVLGGATVARETVPERAAPGRGRARARRARAPRRRSSRRSPSGWAATEAEIVAPAC